MTSKWGDLYRFCQQAYCQEMDIGVDDIPDQTEDWLEALCHVSIEAAITDPTRFCVFCEYYLRGPGGSWAMPSDRIEPLSRPDAEADLWEWMNGSKEADRESWPFEAIIASGLLVELRLKPLMLAVPFLLRSIRDVDENDDAALEDINSDIRSTFFAPDSEEWGDEEIDVLQMKTVGKAFSEFCQGISSARSGEVISKATGERLSDLADSFQHEEIPPEQRPPGSSGRYGLVHLRNHTLHGNHSRTGEQDIALDYATIFDQLLEGEEPTSYTTIKGDQLNSNLRTLFGLTALHTAWETCLRNLYYWLDSWEYNVHRHPPDGSREID